MKKIKLGNSVTVPKDNLPSCTAEMHEHEHNCVVSNPVFDVEISLPSTFLLPPECVIAHLQLGQYLADEPANLLAGLLSDKSRREMAKSFQGAFATVIYKVESAFRVTPNITPEQLLGDLERMLSESKADFVQMDVELGSFPYRTQWGCGWDLGFAAAISLLRQIAQSSEPMDF